MLAGDASQIDEVFHRCCGGVTGGVLRDATAGRRFWGSRVFLDPQKATGPRYGGVHGETDTRPIHRRGAPWRRPPGNGDGEPRSWRDTGGRWTAHRVVGGGYVACRHNVPLGGLRSDDAAHGGARSAIRSVHRCAEQRALDQAIHGVHDDRHDPRTGWSVGQGRRARERSGHRGGDLSGGWIRNRGVCHQPSAVSGIGIRTGF